MTVKLSDYELGWLVGLLEGEGHFRYQGTQHVVLASTDEDVVISCSVLFTKLTGKEFMIGVDKNGRTEGSPRKDIYRIVACGESARMILRTVVPFFHARRRARIWQVLNKYKEAKGKKLTLAEAGFDIQSLLQATNARTQ